MTLHYVLIDPDKQVVVPREPTNDMWAAAARNPTRCDYITMVAAAPAVEPAMTADYVRRLMRCVVDIANGFIPNDLPPDSMYEAMCQKHADLISQCRAEVEKGG